MNSFVEEEVSDRAEESMVSEARARTSYDDEEEETWLPLDYDSWDDENEHFMDESAIPVVGNLPAQLHPAVSMGMRHVSSCYFSIQTASEASNSVADLLSLLEETSIMEEAAVAREQLVDSAVLDENNTNEHSVKWNGSAVLFHDIMMHIFTFLDAPALAAFSQTGRRPNFECFYFLQLQLQRAMLVDSHLKSDDDALAPSDSLDAIAGVGCLSRLAAMDEEAATNIIQEYNDSNSTLRQMPLSHSLAYIRQVLRRNGFRTPEGAPPNAIAGAAFVITLMGAASYMGAASPETYTTALPNALFKVGLAGSLMRAGVTARDAARKMSDADESTSTNTQPVSMRDAAEQMARMMQEMPSQMLQQLQSSVMKQNSDEQPTATSFPSSIASRMYTAFSSAYGPSEDNNNASSTTKTEGKRKRRSKRSRKGGVVAKPDQSIARIDEGQEGIIQEEAMLHPLTPNPYEHIQQAQTDEENESSSGSSTEAACNASSDARKMPSGCVGAYSRAVRQAASQVTLLLKEKRKANFEALSVHEQLQVSRTFIDACASDETLSTVKDLVQNRNIVDVDGFYTTSDGTETCALHTATFNGACRVLEFLCAGIDEHSADKDGGLCNVNLKDENQWTALHFAAGANSVEAVKILARRGAQLAVEAANGYTPYHWAQRLSNDDVAKELQKLGADQRFLEMGPLSAIASRFFSLIPAH